MARSTRFVLITLGTVVVLIVVAILALPLFLNADNFRTRIESTLSASLNRKVSIGKLELSVWAGGLTAQNTVIADDANYSSQPFLQADSMKIRVELLPLLLHREIHIRGFVLDTPKINLLRSATGAWNYSTIGTTTNSKPAAQSAQTKQTFPDLTVSHIEVQNGSITIGSTPGATGPDAMASRTYQKVNLDVTDFAFTKSFPFKVSAQLPANGTVSLNGNAGPLNQQDASATPFSAHVEIKHVDPLASGFVASSDGVSGLVDSIVVDAAWSGQQMHVSKLIIDSPRLTLVRTNAPKNPVPAAAKPAHPTFLQSLSVDDAEIKNGSLTLTTAGQSSAPAVYQQLNAQITNLTPTTASPFSLSAQLPGGGSLSANGKAGPFDQANNAATPVAAMLNLKHVHLGSTGILPPDADLGGIADLQAQVQSNGKTLNANGNARVDGIRLAKDGQPSGKPVLAQFAIAQDENAKTGQIQHATITIGRAAINIGGTYQSSGPTTAVDLKVNGNAMPIDELEAFLRALGVHLPQGSRLQGGTLTTTLTVSGSTANPVISGPVQIQNTQLAGFDLGSKLGTLSKLTGGKVGAATGSGTNIRSLSMTIREAGGGIRTDKVALDVAGLGTATGAGSVSAAGALDYNMLLKLTELTGGAASAKPASSAGGLGALGGLAGFIPGGAAGGGIGAITGGLLKSGIPVMIGGTTSHPTFAPNLRGLTTSIGASAAQGALKGKLPATNGNSNPLKNALGGFLGKH